MKKILVPLLIIVGILLLVGSWLGGKYNKLVTADEDVKKAWSGVQTQYQRRADVISSQVDVVRGAASNEKEILLGVTKARAGITEAKEGMGQANSPAELDKYLAQAQSAALNLKIQIEAYPQIRSTEAFLKLQDEVSGTENRISVVRDDYNAVVTDFNKKVRTFPGNIFANIVGFEQKEQFESQAGSDKRPDISF